MTQREFIDFLGHVKTMKTNLRHNWTIGERRESVADHSWRLAIMPMLLKDEFPDVDIDRVIKLCIVHDLGEAITGDIPCFNKTEENEITEREAIKSLVNSLPCDVKDEFESLFREIYELKSPEAKLYKALDSMEAVISHNEADISTWEPHEYSLQITHGTDKVAYNEWLTELKQEVNRDTEKKIAAEKQYIR